MAEVTKALHQAASTLKKNPGRVQRLVKAAALRIVPPAQYATGKVRKSLEKAVKKLKTPATLGGADPSTASKKFFKEASEKAKDATIAGATTLSTTMLGAGIARDNAERRIKGRLAIKHTNDARNNPLGIDKRLAKDSKAVRRMAKPIRRATIKGGLAGAALGVGLGAAHLKKEASMGTQVGHRIKSEGEFIGKGVIPADAKDVTPKEVLKRKARKAGKVALGVTAAGGLALAAKHRMEKKAEDHTVGLAATGAALAGARRLGKDAKTASSGLTKQVKYIASQGQGISPIDVKMAINSLAKPIKNRVLRSAGKGALAGALVGAAANRLGHKKSAAEAITRDGQKYRKGDTVSAAANMAGFGAGTRIANNHAAIVSAKKFGVPVPKGTYFKGLGQAVTTGAMIGGAYGLVRGALRKARGEKSLSHADFKKMKDSK